MLDRASHRLQAFNAPSANMPDIDARRIMSRFLTLTNVFSIDDFVRGWFFGAPKDSIMRGNVDQLVAYAIFNTPYAQLGQEVSVYCHLHRTNLTIYRLTLTLL